MQVKLPPLFFACALLLSAGSGVDEARKLYNITDFEESLKLLQEIPEKNAAAYELIGRNYYMLGDYKKATDALEKAAAQEPSNAEIALWMGRAYGFIPAAKDTFSSPRAVGEGGG